MQTLETLLSLLDSKGNPKDQVSFELLKGQAAIADLWDNICEHGVWWESEHFPNALSFEDLPDYPTSLDAIFAAEERLGLHDVNNTKLRCVWGLYAEEFYQLTTKMFIENTGYAFISPAIRTAAFILTAQYKKNKEL